MVDEEIAQLTELLDKPANGQTLVCLYNIIKKWVLEQLKSSGEKLDEDSVKTIVNNILNASNYITEDEVTTIVNNIISSTDSITKEQVQEMINDSVWAAMTTAY